MIEEKLNSLKITLPNPPTPAGSYIPAVKTGNLLFISGQIPMKEGKVLFTGKVSDDNLETAQKSAKILKQKKLVRILIKQIKKLQVLLMHLKLFQNYLLIF